MLWHHLPAVWLASERNDMDFNYVLLIAFTATLLFIFVQRTEKARRRMAGGFAFIGFLLIRHNAFLKGDLHDETLLAFVIGLLMSGLFWLLIGRYNPVGSSDDIDVIGMND